jgi:hypothetical protein
MTTIRLDLNKHCVETEIRRQYNRTLSAYFKSGADKRTLEEKIDILQRALETLDFKFLRSSYPTLAGNSDAEVILAGEEEKGLAVQINGTAVDLGRRPNEA